MAWVATNSFQQPINHNLLALENLKKKLMGRQQDPVTPIFRLFLLELRLIALISSSGRDFATELTYMILFIALSDRCCSAKDWH